MALNIILVGFMGAGKSVVGRELAARLQRELVDTDELIAGLAGKPIPAIFAGDGEAAFRDYETQAARHVAARRGLVVATGGGILGREENLRALRSSGRLICLTARPETILRRTRPWEGRPLLAGAADPAARVAELLAARAAQYARADLTVGTDDRTPAEVVDVICSELPSLLGTAPTTS